MPREKARLYVWVGDVLVSTATARKIHTNHRLNPDEIAKLATSPPLRIGRFVRDERGSRVYLSVRNAAGQDVLVVLHPAGDDVWYLASAYVQKRRGGHHGRREG